MLSVQCLLLTLMLWSASVPWAFAQTAEQIALEPFRGIRGVGVSVDAMKPAGQQGGLIASEVHTQVERRLRDAGIRVLSREEAIETPGMPYLYVYVDTTKTEAGVYAYEVRVSLNQGVALDRNAAIKVHTETWNSAKVGTVAVDKLHQVSNTIDTKVDEFIAAYRGANLLAAPEPGPATEKAKPMALESIPEPESPKTPESVKVQEQAEEQEGVQLPPTIETSEPEEAQGDTETLPDPENQVEAVATEDAPKERKRGLRSSGPRTGNAPRSERSR